jgi:hypothetical protein
MEPFLWEESSQFGIYSVVSGLQHHLGSKYLRFNILVDHFGLMVIGGVFSGLRNPYGKPASGRIGIKRGTSFKASIEFLRGPEKSPYSIVRLTLLPSTSISCTALADG